MEKKDLENTLDRIHSWARNADQKVSIFIAFQSVMITFLIPNLLKNIFDISNFNILPFFVALLLILYSIYKSIHALIPKIKAYEDSDSIIYFGTIAEIDQNKFKEKWEKMTSHDYDDALINQIYVNSKITMKKYSLFRDSVLFFVAGLVIILFCYVLLFIPNLYG